MTLAPVSDKMPQRPPLPQTSEASTESDVDSVVPPPPPAPAGGTAVHNGACMHTLTNSRIHSYLSLMLRVGTFMHVCMSTYVCALQHTPKYCRLERCGGCGGRDGGCRNDAHGREAEVWMMVLDLVMFLAGSRGSKGQAFSAIDEDIL